MNTKQVQMRRKQITKRSRKSIMTEVYGIARNLQSYQPRWMRADLKYCEQFLITVTAGAVTDQNFRANSLFDPDRTGTGHQPRGFDQLSAIYNRYRVDSLKWEVRFTASSAGYNCCTAIVNGAQTYTTIVDIGETNLQSPIKTQGAGATGEVFTGKVPLYKLQGRSELAYHIDDLTGAEFGATPVETIDLHILIQNPNAGSILINYVVTLTYDAIFYDPILPGQS